MSSSRRRRLGHGPQQPTSAAAVVRDLQPHVHAAAADVDRAPLWLDVGLDDELVRFRDLGILGPQSPPR
ncbi:hypothetical protein ABTY53_21010 [Streptomyces noursei]|uniref:hypothetical protein n=1 Tax=Streptomyces noursei TaxID=1971 RepID=UPI0033325CF0